MPIPLWAIVVKDGNMEKVTSLEGVQYDPLQSVAMFNGTLDQFADQWKKPFRVNYHGLYITVD